jgi:hypothetical protein
MNTEKDNKIIKSVFRIGDKPDHLEPAIERQYGIGYHGFNVSSCQFAIHYMFENKSTFYNFMRNVAECTAENGYFIATTYDGKEVFHMLRRLNIDQQVERYLGDKKIWSIQKKYDNETFENNDTSLGYQINVYQDSINKTIPEYLVNPEFLIKSMEMYGFSLVPNEECKRYFKIRHSTDTFRYLYNEFITEIEDKLTRKMYKDIEKEYGKAYDMTNEEKDVSFLNRYYIFKKVATRDVSALTETLISGTSYEGEEQLLDDERIKDTLRDVRNIISKPEKSKTQGDGNENKEGEEEEMNYSQKIIDSKKSTAPDNEESVSKPVKSVIIYDDDDEEEELVVSKIDTPSKKEKSSKKTTRKSEKSEKGEKGERSEKGEKSEKTKTKKQRESSIQTVEEMKKKRSNS